METAIILAAGLGNGLKPLTTEVPKCLTEINGTPILENTLKILNKKGFTRAIIVIGYLGAQVKDKVGDRFGNIDITYIENVDYASTGSIYSASLAKDYLTEECLFIESDTIFEEKIVDCLLQADNNRSYWVATTFAERFIGCRLSVGDHERIEHLEVLKATQKIPDNQKYFFKSIGLLKFSEDFARSIAQWLDDYVKEDPNGYFGEAIAPHLDDKELYLLNVDRYHWFEIDHLEDIRAAERVFQPPKFVVLIADGAADESIPELGDKTPFEVAKTPHLDFITSNGSTFLVNTAYPGLPVGSIVANMGIMGYNPARYYPVGRASYEALAQSIHLSENDIAFRCNLISVDNGIIKDFTAEMIPSSDALNIINNLKIEDKDIEIYSGQSYRNILILRNACFSARDVIAYEPHNNIGTPIEDIMLTSNKESVKKELQRLNKILFNSMEQIRLLNKNFHTKADMLWLWSPSISPRKPSFFSKFNLNGAIVAGIDFMRGIGVSARMETKEIHGATGYLDTNLKEKLKYAKNFLRNNDYVFIHYNATDEESHAHNVGNKVEAIERFDRELLGPLLEHLKENYANNFRMAYLPDHYTFLSNGMHGEEPVPCVIYGKDIDADEVRKYSEKDIINKKIIKSYEFNNYFLASKS